ncbi:hypothetical protein DFH09DRAFT_1097023 [Mycena vulgaris]|nr:hypothetical protein DFH09DRAFT_1097023 [Mycena vulgaris]
MKERRERWGAMEAGTVKGEEVGGVGPVVLVRSEAALREVRVAYSALGGGAAGTGGTGTRKERRETARTALQAGAARTAVLYARSFWGTGETRREAPARHPQFCRPIREPVVAPLHLTLYTPSRVVHRRAAQAHIYASLMEMHARRCWTSRCSRRQRGNARGGREDARRTYAPNPQALISWLRCTVRLKSTSIRDPHVLGAFRIAYNNRSRQYVARKGKAGGAHAQMLHGLADHPLGGHVRSSERAPGEENAYGCSRFATRTRGGICDPALHVGRLQMVSMQGGGKHALRTGDPALRVASRRGPCRWHQYGGRRGDERREAPREGTNREGGGDVRGREAHLIPFKLSNRLVRVPTLDSELRRDLLNIDGLSALVGRLVVEGLGAPRVDDLGTASGQKSGAGVGGGGKQAVGGRGGTPRRMRTSFK